MRSAQLIWRPDIQSRHHKSDSKNHSQSFESKPWQTHRLYLHCNIDTHLLTVEGTEEVRQQTKQETLKKLKGRESLTEEQLQELDLTDNQRSYVKRLQSTLSRLDNPAPPRPSANRYQGNPLITVKLSFNPQTALTACIVDLQTGNTLNCQDAKQLLTVKNIKTKCGNRSILQLKLERWRLVNKLHFRQQRNLLKQPEEYKKGYYKESDSESNLGLHVERLLASRLVQLAIKWRAGSIAVPDLKHIREILESDIQARAKRKYPAQKKLQDQYTKQLRNTIYINTSRKEEDCCPWDQYAKQFRNSIHRWSYSRLVQCIRDRASREGIIVITGRQPLQEEPQQKATQVATSAHAT